MSEVRQVKLDDLVIGPGQARLRAVEADLDELVESIRLHGLLEPIVVTPDGERGRYQIISGQRRYLAHRKLGRPTIAAVVLPSVDDATARVLSLTENVVRRDLDPKDLVDICTALFRKYGTASAVAQETGIPYSKVRKYVKYDRLAPELRELVGSGGLSLDVALLAQDVSTDSVSLETDNPRAVTIASQLSSLNQRQLGQVKRLLRKVSDGVDMEPEQVIASVGQQTQYFERTGSPMITVMVAPDDFDRLDRYSQRRGVSVQAAASRALSSGLKTLERAANSRRGRQQQAGQSPQRARRSTR